MGFYSYSEIPENVYELLGLSAHDKVELIAMAREIIIRKALTNAEKREQWVAETLPTIPVHVFFVRDNNVTIAYKSYEGNQKSAFTICDSSVTFDASIGKCIAYFKLCGWDVPDYVFED